MGPWRLRGEHAALRALALILLSAFHLISYFILIIDKGKKQSPITELYLLQNPIAFQTELG
jgi:hypothetical protein